MPLIGLFGPHAIGKTTAVSRWVKRYSGLHGVFADIQRRFDGQEEIREKGWKGSFQDKSQLLSEARARADIVTVIESCASHGSQLLRSLTADDYVIHVYCSAESLRENLKARAKRLGKKYSSYWDDDGKCEYEAFRRLHGCALRCLPPSRLAEFLIKDYEADWPAVDEYFGKLFRKLHNEIVRRRR